MQILHLLSQTELTGAEVYAQNLISAQNAAGHSVFVASDQIHLSLPVAWTQIPLSVNKCLVRRKNCKAVRKLLQEHRIDVIHCHSRAAVRVASSARRGLKIAMVSTIHGRQHHSWGKRLVDSYGEYKILVCENLKQQFTTELRSKPGSLKLIRNPFPIPTILSAKKSVHKKIAFVGRSSGPKGERFKQLCELGLFSLLERFPDWKFDIIAANPQNFGESFLHRVAALKNQGQVQILSEVKDLTSRYQQYDLVLGAGRVAMEALLRGCAVLSFGEFTSHGMVTNKNLNDCLTSNFGDMGAEAHEGPLNEKPLLTDLETFLHHPPTEIDLELLRNLGAEVDEVQVNEAILETYKAAVFKRHITRHIPILMYHKVPDDELKSRHRIFVTKAHFQKHLEYFHKNHFSTLHFRDLEEFWNLRRPYTQFPKKPLILTFDDGYRDNLTNALPLLEKMKIKATLFLLSDHSIQQNNWDLDPSVGSTEQELQDKNSEPASELLNFSERQEMASSPQIEIGSHGIDHQKLTELDDNKVLYQLHYSKILLEMEFRRPIHSVAFPFGAVDRRLPQLAKLAGYDFAVNTDQGGLFFSDEPRSLFRVNIFPEENRFSLWKKTSSWYRKRFFKKHGK